MSMFCFQCQETARNNGCTVRGVCGKDESTAKTQDLLVHVLKGISLHARAASAAGAQVPTDVGRFVAECLFSTITNVDFDSAHLSQLVGQALEVRAQLRSLYQGKGPTHDSATWTGAPEDYLAKAAAVGVLSTENEDQRSLRELLVYGLKGISAYADHAAVLGLEDPAIYEFLFEALASTTEDLSVDEMVALVLKAGEIGVTTMALLDRANTETYGNPELSEVQLGVGSRPGILVSGHDLKDLEELL